MSDLYISGLIAALSNVLSVWDQLCIRDVNAVQQQFPQNMPMPHSQP